jgi:hypothetical protein
MYPGKMQMSGLFGVFSRQFVNLLIIWGYITGFAKQAFFMVRRLSIRVRDA